MFKDKISSILFTPQTMIFKMKMYLLNDLLKFFVKIKNKVLFYVLKVDFPNLKRKQTFLCFPRWLGNDHTIGWQNLNPLSHPNATLAPYVRQARASGYILN